MIIRSFFVSLILFISTCAWARQTSGIEQIQAYALNVGNHTEFFDGVQNDANGGTRKIDFAPTIGGSIVLPISESLTFHPEINWVLPHSSDTKIIKNLFMFRADLGYTLVDWFRLRLGTSLMWLNQHGSGGSTEVSNGNTSSTFYYPDENRSSLNNTLDLGAEFLIDQWALRLQTYVYSAFKEERRQISYTVFVSYYWDQTK
jgi:hypothetical protein